MTQVADLVTSYAMYSLINIQYCYTISKDLSPYF